MFPQDLSCQYLLFGVLSESINQLILAINIDIVQALPASAYDFIVDQQGEGDYKTVQEAIDAVPDFRKTRTTIFIRNGIYKEKIEISSSKTNLVMFGEDVNELQYGVILTGRQQNNCQYRPMTPYATRSNIYKEAVTRGGAKKCRLVSSVSGPCLGP